MSLLSYLELVELVESGVIEGVDPLCINSASIDVHLGNQIVAEVPNDYPVDIHKREIFSSTKYLLGEGGTYTMLPGEFILAQTKEIFHLPNNIVAEFYLKSSGARTGLEHLHAGHCDPGWNNSVLTLELKNVLRYQPIVLTEGMRIGQMLFYRVREVPENRSYATIGRYNGDKSAQTVKL